MSNKTYGLNIERKYRKLREKDSGFVGAVKSAGSFGNFDLLLLSFLDEKHNLGLLELISIKSSRKKLRSLNSERRKLNAFKIPSNLIAIKKLVKYERGKFSEETLS